jgi:hypothetical protein
MIRSALIIALALALALAAAPLGCSGQVPPVLAPPGASCGNQCASLNCPPGSHCTLDGRCTPHCEPEMLQPR